MIDFLAKFFGNISSGSPVIDVRPVPNHKKIVKFRSNPNKSYLKPLFNDFDMWHQKSAYDTILVSFDNN